LQHYFDLGKSEFFAALLGVRQRGEGTELITASTATSYFLQTRYEARIFVETSLERIGNKSFGLVQRIVNADTGAVHAESHTAMVAFDFTSQQTVAIPDLWRSKMERAMDK
jgi:acyl-CoA thioesterase FadM